MNLRFLILWVAGLVSAVSISLAQTADEPISTAVKFQGTMGVSGAHTFSVTLNNTTSVGSTIVSNTISTPLQTAFLEVGKIYNLTSSVSPTTNTSNVSIIVTPPTGYILTVNGVAQSKIAITSATTVLSVRVIPTTDLVAKSAGTASSITSGQVKWSVALGALKNGSSAGSLSIVDSGTSNWSGVFTPAELYYESTSSEVFVYRVNGNVRQVSANESVLKNVISGGA